MKIALTFLIAAILIPTSAHAADQYNKGSTTRQFKFENKIVDNLANNEDFQSATTQSKNRVQRDRTRTTRKNRQDRRRQNQTTQNDDRTQSQNRLSQEQRKGRRDGRKITNSTRRNGQKAAYNESNAGVNN